MAHAASSLLEIPSRAAGARLDRAPGAPHAPAAGGVAADVLSKPKRCWRFGFFCACCGPRVLLDFGCWQRFDLSGALNGFTLRKDAGYYKPMTYECDSQKGTSRLSFLTLCTHLHKVGGPFSFRAVAKWCKDCGLDGSEALFCQGTQWRAGAPSANP